MNLSAQAPPALAGGLPPGPSLSPGRQLLRYLRSPSHFFDRCMAAYGEIFSVELGRGRRWVVVCSPRLVRELFHSDPLRFEAGAAKRSIFEAVVGSRSSLVLDGPEHLARRRAMTPILAGEKSEESTQALVALCRSKLASWPVAAPFALHERFQEIVFQAIFTSVFGPKTPAREPLYRALLEMTERVVGSRLLLLPSFQLDLGPLSPWGRIRRIMARVDAQIDAALELGPPADGVGGEVLSGLLSLRTPEGQPLSRKEIRDELVTAIVAGHEITGISMAWAAANLAVRPEVMSRIRLESHAAMGHRHYLEASIKESLRVSSAVAIGSARRLKEDASFGGFHLPAGTMLVAYFHGLHRNPGAFPQPDRFLPERFLPEGLDGLKPDPYAWIPFGGGQRRCLGAQLALHQMKTVLATVFSEGSLTLEGDWPEGVRRGAFIAPKGGPLVRWSPYNAHA
jgi:cytochrome P450